MKYNFDEIVDRRHTNALNTDGFRGYIFHDFEGRTLMCLHSHKKYSQNHVDRRPHFFTVSLKGNRLEVMQEFKPVSAVE